MANEWMWWLTGGDEDDKDRQRNGYSSPWTDSPDDRSLLTDDTRLKEEPCVNCGTAFPIFEALLVTPDLPVGELETVTKVGPDGAPVQYEIGSRCPLYWRCPQCGAAEPVVLDRFHAR